jgi:hypothetical protein
MATTYKWLLRQFGKLVLLPDYFRVIAKEWLNILFGETLVGIAFLLWWSLAGPSNAKLIVVFVEAMFVAGYYAWRADHIRLMPKLEVTRFTRQTTDTFDQNGKKNGWSEYLQLLPRCLTEENVPWSSYFHRNVGRILQQMGRSGMGGHVPRVVAR